MCMLCTVRLLKANKKTHPTPKKQQTKEKAKKLTHKNKKKPRKN